MKVWLFSSHWWLGISLFFLMISCEDNPILEYHPRFVVEAYLLVGEPIQNIYVYQSQPLTDSFRYEQALIANAEVRLIDQLDTLHLQFAPNKGYFYPDTTRHVLPNHRYTLQIYFPDGTMAWGSTITPDSIQWIDTVPATLQYPKHLSETVSSDSIQIRWSIPDPAPEVFLISIRCLDTLEYGRYLSPPRDEQNERIDHPFNRLDPYPREITRWGFFTANWLPIIWTAFKWYGLHEIAVYNPDPNMIKWFKQTHFGRFPRFTPLLNSISGNAIGVVGSAFVLRDTTFILKPPQ